VRVRVSPNPNPDRDPKPKPKPNPNRNQALLAPPPSGRAPTAPTGLAELRAMPPDQCHLAFDDVVARCMQVSYPYPNPNPILTLS